MERKSLDIRFTEHPYPPERNNVSIPAFPARDNGSRALLWYPKMKKHICSKLNSMNQTLETPQQLPGLMFHLFWDIFKNA